MSFITTSRSTGITSVVCGVMGLKGFYSLPPEGCLFRFYGVLLSPLKGPS